MDSSEWPEDLVDEWKKKNYEQYWGEKYVRQKCFSCSKQNFHTVGFSQGERTGRYGPILCAASLNGSLRKLPRLIYEGSICKLAKLGSWYLICILIGSVQYIKLHLVGLFIELLV